MNLLQEYRHFLKHVDYSTEDEYRLLKHKEKPDGWFINRDNGILTPYIESKLWNGDTIDVDDYPFKLDRIILGPAMREKNANLIQVLYMIHQYGYYLSVEESGIDSYR